MKQIIVLSFTAILFTTSVSAGDLTTLTGFKFSWGDSPEKVIKVFGKPLESLSDRLGGVLYTSFYYPGKFDRYNVEYNFRFWDGKLSTIQGESETTRDPYGMYVEWKNIVTKNIGKPSRSFVELSRWELPDTTIDVWIFDDIVMITVSCNHEV